MREFPTSADPIVLMGNVQGKHGNTTEAVKFWEKGLALNPKRADVYVGMGWYAMRKGQYDEAIGHWRKALQINPQIPSVHNYIARALIVLGKQKEAVEELEKDIKSSESGLSYFLLGQEYLRRKEYDKAKEKYEKAIVLQPNLTNAYYGLFTVCTRLKQDAKAKEYMTVFKKLKAEDTAEEKKDLTDRTDALGDLAATRKNVAETYMEAERIYRARGNMAKAEQLLKRAATLDPTNTLCLMKLASVYRKSNRIPDALQMYERMSKIEPKNPTGYLNIGVVSVQLKRFDEAEEAFRKAIRLAPENSGAYRELAQLYLKMSTKFLEAKLLAEKAVALEPVAANYFVLSWACDKNGETASALSAMKRAIELDPDNPKYKRMYELMQNRD
jgi:tetratricopeptide (TPR) repeat protein